MDQFLLIVLALLIVGPLRKWLLSSWRTIVPVLAGGLVGFVIAVKLVSSGAPAWMLVFGPLAGVFLIGSEGRNWLYDSFPPEKK